MRLYMYDAKVRRTDGSIKNLCALAENADEAQKFLREDIENGAFSGIPEDSKLVYVSPAYMPDWLAAGNRAISALDDLAEIRPDEEGSIKEVKDRLATLICSMA